MTKTWMKVLVALVSKRGQALIHRRVDWRGRPLVHNLGEATVSRDTLFATLCLRLTQESGQQEKFLLQRQDFVRRPFPKR